MRPSSYSRHDLVSLSQTVNISRVLCVCVCVLLRISGGGLHEYVRINKNLSIITVEN